jgi:hypothetical protein
VCIVASAGGVEICGVGRKRRGGFYFAWFKGDHEPRHVHVFDARNRFMGRVRLDTHEYLEGGRPPAAVIAIIREFQQTGVL